MHFTDWADHCLLINNKAEYNQVSVELSFCVHPICAPAGSLWASLDFEIKYQLQIINISFPIQREAQCQFGLIIINAALS